MKTNMRKLWRARVNAAKSNPIAQKVLAAFFTAKAGARKKHIAIRRELLSAGITTEEAHTLHLAVRKRVTAAWNKYQRVVWDP